MLSYKSAALALFAASAGLTLGGCEQDYAVAVVSERGRVLFRVAKTDRYCLQRLAVYAAEDRAKPIWLIDASGSPPCTIQVAYGTVPAGFTQRGPIASLVPGRRYVVSVARTGATGLATFEPGRDGDITREP